MVYDLVLFASTWYPFTEMKQEVKEEGDELSSGQSEAKTESGKEIAESDKPDINATLAQELVTLQTENKRLHEQATSLHERHHTTTLQVPPPSRYHRPPGTTTLQVPPLSRYHCTPGTTYLQVPPPSRYHRPSGSTDLPVPPPSRYHRPPGITALRVSRPFRYHTSTASIGSPQIQIKP